MKRESWKSSLGFVFAALGSAVGIANICIFPYLVAKFGGAIFIMMYLFCLALIGFPAFISEILIGRTTSCGPAQAFKRLTGSRRWSACGKITVFTGFLVTSFYSVLAGWVLGYFIEALRGNLGAISSPEMAQELYHRLVSTPLWTISFHAIFMFICAWVVYGGVRSGIERCGKIMMPLLLIILFSLVVRGLFLPGAGAGLRYLFFPDWSEFTVAAMLVALGQSFFTLSLGQGTMVTFGSYLNKEDDIVKISIPVGLGDTLISLGAAVVIFTTVFSVGMESTEKGLGLIFQTLPIVFNQLPGGLFLAIGFFLFVTLAALTSQVSAMEPVIAYFVDNHRFTRKKAVLFCSLASFSLGIPSALSYSLLKNVLIGDVNFIDAVQILSQTFLIPLGGLFAVVLVGWVWGCDKAISALSIHKTRSFSEKKWFRCYLYYCIKYIAPILIILVFCNQVINLW